MRSRTERAYRWVLRFLPRELRGGFEKEMVQDFLERMEGARGPLARTMVWARGVSDVVMQGVSERWALRGVVRGRARGSQPLGALGSDLRHSWKALWRSPSFTLTAVSTLALGIAGATVSFTLVDGVLLRPLPFPEDHDLVVIHEQVRDGQTQTLSFPNYDDLRSQAHSFEGIAALRFAGEATVLGGEDPVRGVVVPVSREFFSVLGVRPLLGRTILPEENRRGGAAVAVVAYEFWTRVLGSEEDLGSLTIHVEGNPYSVVGVMPPGFRVLDDADVYLPLEHDPFMVRSSSNYRAVGRLAQGVTLTRAQVEMDGLAARIRESYPDEAHLDGILMRPLREVVLGDLSRPLLLLLGASGILLLLACSNVASTLMARSILKERELAVRKALGGGRWGLARLALAESSLLALMAGAAGWGISAGSVELLKAQGAGFIPRLSTVTLDWRVLAFALGSAALTPLLFGILPALKVPEAAEALRSGSMGNTRRRGVGGWDLLVGGQVALAVTLVVASALLIRSMREILTTETNMRQEGVLTLELDLSGEPAAAAGTRGYWIRELKEELASVPGVLDVGFVSYLPNVRSRMTGAIFEPPMPEEGLPEVVALEVGWRVVDEDYFRAAGIPLRKGRFFNEADGPDSPPVLILNEAVERVLYPEGESLGARVLFVPFWSDTEVEIVGVVAEARDWRVPEGEQLEAFVFWPQRLGYTRELTAVIHTAGDPGRLVPLLRDRLHSLGPSLPAAFVSMEERTADSVRDRTFTLWVLGGFAALSLFLSGVGIFGVVSYTISSRAREIGIRLALGAGRGAVRSRMFVRSSWAVLAGAILGVLVSLLEAGILESLLYEVDPRDPLAFTLAPAVLLMAAALAILLPVIRYTRVDPVRAMKEE